MINLNDYLGSIVASFTNAKILSDMQTVKVAEEYAKHDYLKHFSIPRMRIDDVEMTIPIALEDIENQTKPAIIHFDSVAINKMVYALLLEKTRVTKITREPAKLIQVEITKNVSTLEKNIKLLSTHEPINSFAKEMTLFFVNIIEKYAVVNKDIFAQINQEVVAKELTQALTQAIEIKKENLALSNLNIIVEASKLRELKPENLILIKLKISENGMEWSRSENSRGEVESKLLPE